MVSISFERGLKWERRLTYPYMLSAGKKASGTIFMVWHGWGPNPRPAAHGANAVPLNHRCGNIVYKMSITLYHVISSLFQKQNWPHLFTNHAFKDSYHTYCFTAHQTKWLLVLFYSSKCTHIQISGIRIDWVVNASSFFNQWWHTHITAASLPIQLNWAYQWSPLNSLSKMFLLHMSQMWRTYWQQQWTVPQLSVMIIYNSTWSILIQWV